MIQKKLKKQMLSTFINNKFNLQEKINKLDYKIEDLRKYLHFCMNYKNELVVEMEFLIFNDPKNNLNNLSIKHIRKHHLPL